MVVEMAESKRGGWIHNHIMCGDEEEKKEVKFVERDTIYRGR